MRFSYIDDLVRLASIVPAKNIPQKRVINGLLIDVREHLPDCRRDWWLTQRTACLAGRWAVVIEPGKIELVSKFTPNAKQIKQQTQYDPETERLRIVFQDGTTEEVRLRA